MIIRSYPLIIRRVSSRGGMVPTRTISNIASGFIEAMIERMPFPIKAIQVGGGSKFEDVFEYECV